MRHPEAGTILIDTGLHRDATESVRKDFGPAMWLLFRGLRPAGDPFDVQLRDLAIDPAKVDRVLMTHLHVDHTSGMRLLPAATFTCTRQEWQAANGRGASANGYVGHHLPSADRVDQVDIERDGVPHGPFARTVDLLGDGSIRLVWTPGHTVGHMSVLLELEDGRRALIAGDAAYTLRSIDEALLPMLTSDDEASLRSMGEIKAFMDAEPDAVVVPTHDPTAWQALRMAP